MSKVNTNKKQDYKAADEEEAGIGEEESIQKELISKVRS